MINFKKDFEKFYMQRRFSSLTSPNPPDIDYFKDFNSAKKIEVELKENHMLFIPAGWFHMVISEEDDKYGINSAMGFFTAYDGCLDCDLDVNNVYNTEIGNETDETIDYKKYIKESRPCLISPTSVVYNENITPDNLIKNIPGVQYVLKSDHERFFSNDYIKDIYPDYCKFEKMTVEEFLNQDEKKGYITIDGANPYKICIPRPKFTTSEKEKNFCFLLNFGKGIHGVLHYDSNNNTLLQLRGTKKLILLPPSERSKAHLVNKLDTKFLCALNNMIKNMR